MVRTDRLAHRQARGWVRRWFRYEVNLMIVFPQPPWGVGFNADNGEIAMAENLCAGSTPPVRYRRVFPIRRPVL